MAAGADEYFPLRTPEGPPQKGAARQSDLRPSWKERFCKFLPILEWLPYYNWKEYGLKDLSGGITLGCILVAQSLAHADLCKVDLIHGPYSCILPPILYSLFGTCIHSSIGTGGLISLLTGEQLAHYGDLEQRTHAGAIFTLLVGLVITMMGVFRLAFLVRFLSKPALSGFITASAILIMASQMKPMLGLPKSDTGGIFAIAWFHPNELADLRPATIAVSLGALGYLSIIKRLKSLHWTLRMLGDFKELSALTFFAIAASRFASEFGVAVVGDVPAGLPGLSLPLQTKDDVALAKEMLPGAIMVALVTFLSSFAGAKKFAMQAGYQVIAINELLALGFANLGGAVCGAVPTQIGLSRMGIAYSTGVMSQLGANIYVAALVALVLKLFSAYLFFVPRCVLNVIILLGAQHLTEFQHMRWLWSLRQTRTRQRTYLVDVSVWWVAFLFTIVFGAFKGILGAVTVSLLMVLYQVADPPIARLGFCEERGRWMAVKAHHEVRQRLGVVAFRLEGPLFYANVERLEEWLAEMEVASGAAGQPVKAVILSAAAMPFVDTTALESMKQLLLSYTQRNIAFLVSNVSGQPQKILQHVLGDLLPEGCLTSSWTTEDCVRYLSKQAAEAEASERAMAQALLEVDQVVKEKKKVGVVSVEGETTKQDFRRQSMPASFGAQDRPLSTHLVTRDDLDLKEIKEEPRVAKVMPLRKSSAWASMPHGLNELGSGGSPIGLYAPPSCPDRLDDFDMTP
ncbi:Sulfate transporter 4.1 [Durusdinium trenchii]|uniref:Chloroplastic (AST82) n=1 Tax=Durusdinium trenchii TaxID=1381693 RepID=A0ABP0LG17_9DINO